MNTNKELGRMYKDSVVAYFKVLCEYLCEELRKIMKPLVNSLWSRFKPRISQISSISSYRNITICHLLHVTNYMFLIVLMSSAVNATYVGMSSISTLSDMCDVHCASGASFSMYFSKN